MNIKYTDVKIHIEWFEENGKNKNEAHFTELDIEYAIDLLMIFTGEICEEDLKD